MLRLVRQRQEDIPFLVPRVIDIDSVMIKPEVAEFHRPTSQEDFNWARGAEPPDPDCPAATPGVGLDGASVPTTEKKPTHFVGTVTISVDRPARHIHQIEEVVGGQLTTIPGSEVSL